MRIKNYPLIVPQDGWCELDPQDIWISCKKVLAEVAQQTGGKIHALAVSSHAQAVVPLDAAGKTLYNFIATVDTRTGRELEYWKRTYDEKALYMRTGLPFSAIYTANKLLWLKRNRPDVFGAADRFLCVQDFINWKLTGAAVIDYSLASRGMLLNVGQKDWDREILEIIGIKKSMLAKLVPSGGEVGTLLPQVAEDLHLDPSLQVVSGGHDQTCSCIGSGVLRPGQIMNSCGTVEVLETIVPSFITRDEMLEYHYPCTPYITGKDYLVMSINNSGGLLLQWYLNTFCASEKEKAAGQGTDPFSYVINESSDEISNVYFLPHLNGSETPVQDPESAGAIAHLRVNTTKNEITRGLLDSLSYELRLNLEAIEKSVDYPAKEVRAVGGGARSPKLLQIKADVTQLPVITLRVKESAAFGAAIIAAVGTKVFPSYEQAIEEMVQVAQVYEPNTSLKSAYAEHFAEYKMLYPALRTFNERVSERIHTTEEKRAVCRYRKS